MINNESMLSWFCVSGAMGCLHLGAPAIRSPAHQDSIHPSQWVCWLLENWADHS
jgi:hypothetical protein